MLKQILVHTYYESIKNHIFSKTFFMQQNPFYPGKENMQQLLLDYQNLKVGRKHNFIDEDSFIAIIDYYDETENLSEASIAADIALDQYPYCSELMFRKADILISKRKYKEALSLLETAGIYDNNNISLYILKTDALLALDKQQEAIELLVSALQLFDGEERIDLLFDLADVYDDYEQFDKIFDCLLLILEQDPNNEEALYKICFWTDFTGRFEESIKVHQKIIDDFPYNEIAWFNLGTAYQGLKLYEKSIDAYLFAVAIDDKFDYAYRNMGDAYLRLRKYKEAIENLEKVLELTQPEEVIYEAIAHCYQKIGNIAQARFHYKKAVHLSNNDAKLIYKLATTYMQEGLWQMAIKHLENAWIINKNNKDINLALGECKMQLQKYNEALIYFGNIVLHKTTSSVGWEAVIRCLLLSKNLKEAEEKCVLALYHTQNKPVFYYYYAAVLFAKKKNKEALIQLERALVNAPKLLNKFLDLNTDILQNNRVVELISKYKKTRKK